MKLIISLNKSIDCKSWIGIKSFYLSYNALTLDESTYYQYAHGIRSNYKMRENGQNSILSLIALGYCLVDIVLKITTQICRLITLLSRMSWIVEPDKDIANRGVNKGFNRGVNKSVSHPEVWLLFILCFFWNYTNNLVILRDLKLENSGGNDF